jgi:hypothetical protein
MPLTTMPASAANLVSARATFSNAAWVFSVIASSLLTANTRVGTRSRRASRLWRRVCGSSGTSAAATSSLVMSTSTTAASLPAAAVTMLPVYCSWPGASAMMNLRFLVAKYW